MAGRFRTSLATLRLQLLKPGHEAAVSWKLTEIRAAGNQRTNRKLRELSKEGIWIGFDAAFKVTIQRPQIFSVVKLHHPFPFRMDINPSLIVFGRRHESDDLGIIPRSLVALARDVLKHTEPLYGFWRRFVVHLTYLRLHFSVGTKNQLRFWEMQPSESGMNESILNDYCTTFPHEKKKSE